MSAMNRTIEAGGAMPPATVTVWDRFVRVFHWSLVALFALAFVTGEEIEQVHVAAGYGIAGLVALRLVWGFAGSRHARFSDFVRSPRAVFGYLGEAAAGRSRRYLGHNPAGGAMIVALLTMLTATATTGFMMTTDAFWGAKWVEEVHEASADFMLVLIALHVIGVAVSSIAHRENLVKAMVTGRKRTLPDAS